MPRRKAHERWPGIEVAITGPNGPWDVPARVTVELIESAIAAIEQIQADHQLQAVAPRLVAVRRGSAAAALRAPDKDIVQVADLLEHHVETKGAVASPKLRRALARLQGAGRSYGPVRLATFDAHGDRRSKVLLVDKISAAGGAAYEETTEVYGEVMGVMATHRQATVRLRLDDGAAQEFQASDAIANIAAGLWRKPVRGTALFEVSGDGDVKRATLEVLEAWHRSSDGDDILAAFDRVREELARKGIRLRASEWLVDQEDD